MNSSRTLKVAALGTAIALTVAVKAVTANRADPATGANLQNAVVGMLSRQGFATQASEHNGIVVDGKRQGCHIQIRETYSAGYNLEANALDAPKGARLVYAYRGELLQKYPTLRVSISTSWHSLMWRLGMDAAWSPAVTVAAVGECHLESLPWAELAELHAP